MPVCRDNRLQCASVALPQLVEFRRFCRFRLATRTRAAVADSPCPFAQPPRLPVIPQLVNRFQYSRRQLCALATATIIVNDCAHLGIDSSLLELEESLEQADL